MSTKLTDSFVDDASIPGYYKDSELAGFYLRVTSRKQKDGTAELTKVFLVRAKRHKTRETVSVTIGRFNQPGQLEDGTSLVWTAMNARKQAKIELGKLASGSHVNRERKQAIEQERTERNVQEKKDRAKSITLREMFEKYVRDRKLKPQTKYTYECIVRSRFSDWMDKPLASITKDMVLDRHTEISQEFPGEADNSMRILRAICHFAIAEFEDDDEPIFKVNPVRTLSRHDRWNNAERRQTAIADTDLLAWLQAVKSLRRGVIRDYFLLLLFSGFRKAEGACLRWQRPQPAEEKELKQSMETYGWVDMKEKVICLHNTKNKLPHYLPMTDVLYEILRRRQREALVNAEKCPVENNQFVFPKMQGEGHITFLVQYIDEVTKQSKVPFTPHDLRRTFLSAADDANLGKYKIKALANHSISKTDVTDGYVVRNITRLLPALTEINELILEKAGIDLQWLLSDANNVIELPLAKAQ